jgi:hypothetical protein
MKFFLDSLFISLGLLIILLLYRIIKHLVTSKRKHQPAFAVFHPVSPGDFDGSTLKIRYEIPETTAVSVIIQDLAEALKETLVDKTQEPGNYYVNYQVPKEEQEFLIVFRTANTTTSRRVKL